VVVVVGPCTLIPPEKLLLVLLNHSYVILDGPEPDDLVIVAVKALEEAPRQ
jgi:hypothetical protein